jgi:methenyltetrahydromethanopterin cyclohydrolase
LAAYGVSDDGLTIVGYGVNPDGNREAWIARLGPTGLTVIVDIKPGSDPNSINLSSKGVVPVAVLTTDEFDAAGLDTTTLLFAGASPRRCSLEDVDSDGDEDLVCHFPTQDLTELDDDSTEATLEGQTTGGTPVSGTDSVRIVERGKSGK